MAFGSFSSMFLALCSSSDVAVYLTSELVGFTSCLHPLAFKKSKTNVSGVLLFEIFKQTYLILFYFI